MLCTINTSIWICCKTCYKTTKALYFYCTLCGPASGFHKAVSVYHTWLSNNPVVGQTQLYPEDITPEILRWSSLHMSFPSRSSLSPDFTLFVFPLYYLLSMSEYLTWSYSSSCILCHYQYCSVAWSTLYPMCSHPILFLYSFILCPHVNLNVFLEMLCSIL